MSRPREDVGALRLDELLDRIHTANPGVTLESRLDGKGLVADPRAVEQLVGELIERAAEAVPGKTISVRTLDALRPDERGQPRRWTEVALHQPGAPGHEGQARIAASLLIARARIAAARLVTSQALAPILEVVPGGQGTTVRLLLPCVDPAPAPRRVDPPVGRPLVLVVDDDAAIRQAVTEVAAAEGYRTLSAPNGSVALDHATARIDVLLTDLFMPGMSGFELARRLTIAQPHLKVIFMSALPVRPGTMIPAPFIAKPLDLNVLLGQLPDLLAAVTKQARRATAAQASR